MTKAEFVSAVANQAGVSKKDAEAVIKAYNEVVTDVFKKKDKLTFIGFGTFEVSERAARTGRNPQTGEKISIKPTTVPRFKPSQALRDTVNKRKK